MSGKDYSKAAATAAMTARLAAEKTPDPVWSAACPVCGRRFGGHGDQPEKLPCKH